jgi:hypothetical protein
MYSETMQILVNTNLSIHREISSAVFFTCGVCLMVILYSLSFRSPTLQFSYLLPNCYRGLVYGLKSGAIIYFAPQISPVLAIGIFF